MVKVCLKAAGGDILIFHGRKNVAARLSLLSPCIILVLSSASPQGEGGYCFTTHPAAAYLPRLGFFSRCCLGWPLSLAVINNNTWRGIVHLAALMPPRRLYVQPHTEESPGNRVRTGEAFWRRSVCVGGGNQREKHKRHQSFPLVCN